MREANGVKGSAGAQAALTAAVKADPALQAACNQALQNFHGIDDRRCTITRTHRRAIQEALSHVG